MYLLSSMHLKVLDQAELEINLVLLCHCGLFGEGRVHSKNHVLWDMLTMAFIWVVWTEHNVNF